jgi:hypothetical protein
MVQTQGLWQDWQMVDMLDIYNIASLTVVNREDGYWPLITPSFV